MEFLLFLFAGIIVGMFAGVLPGLGITSTLILSYPFINHLDPISILCFYVALACSVQYFGSVVGIYLGVPGETMALVSSKVGFNLMAKGQGNSALGSTAIASLFAAFFATALLYFLIPNSMWLMPLLSAKVQSIVLVTILIMLIYYGSNNRFLNILLISFGVFLSTIGYNSAGISLTFNTDMFNPGLNSALVLLMIFVIPNLLRFWNSKIEAKSTSIDLNFRKSIGWSLKRWTSIIRGTAVGCLTGLIPGIGPIISSNIAAQVEQRFKKSPSAELLSAEAANNSAIIICFIPFFALGLTLMAHEAIVWDILSNQGTAINAKWLQGLYSGWSRLDIVVSMLLLANIIAFIIAWPASRLLISIYKLISYQKIVYIVLLLSSSLIFYQSYLSFRLDLDILSFILLLPLTVLLTKYKTDTLPLMFSYLLGDSCIRTLILLKNIL